MTLYVYYLMNLHLTFNILLVFNQDGETINNIKYELSTNLLYND